MNLRIDDTIVTCLLVWARTYCKNPKLTFYRSAEGHVLCQVFPSVVGDMEARCLNPLAVTRVQ